MRSLTARVALGAGLVAAVFIALSAFALERAFRDSARSPGRSAFWHRSIC